MDGTLGLSDPPGYQPMEDVALNPHVADAIGTGIEPDTFDDHITYIVALKLNEAGTKLLTVRSGESS